MKAVSTAFAASVLASPCRMRAYFRERLAGGPPSYARSHLRRAFPDGHHVR